MSNFDQNVVIGGFKGEPIKNSMLGKNLKSRGLLSNNLPFRQTNGLAPGSPLQFLWPTGAEAGAYWDLANSGNQYQDVGRTKVSVVSQPVGLQVDSRLPPTIHSVDLNSKPNRAYAGGGANTIGVGNSTITFNNSALNDEVNWLTEFSAAEFPFVTATFLVENISGSVLLFLGNAAALINTNGLITISQTAVTTQWLIWRANAAGTSAKITLLNLAGYPGNHFIQATSTARPIGAVETVSGWNQSVYSTRFDGIDDVLATNTFAAGTLTNNMDAFIAVNRRASTQGIIIADTLTTHYFGSFIPSAGPSTLGVGAPTVFVDGVQLASDDRVLLNNALTQNAWHVLEYRNLNLSALVDIGIDKYAGFIVGINVGTVAICPAQSQANRDLARRIIGAEVGLLL